MMSPDEQADEPQGYDLVMPFVNVASKGGPYDDSAYCAGWAMGALDVRLATLALVSLSETVRTADLDQADLVAMKNGYAMQRHESEVEGWTYVEFTRLSVDA